MAADNNKYLNIDGLSTAVTSIKTYVDNHHDSTKSNLASPTFTGTPSAPTATNATNNTQIATTAFVHSVVKSSIDDAIGSSY